MSTTETWNRSSMLLEGLRMTARIGIREGKSDTPQPIVVDARLEVQKGPPSGPDALVAGWVLEPERREAVCLDTLAARIRGVAASRVWLLVEDLAESLVELCLADSRVVRVVVRVSRPKAIPDADSAGVEIAAEKSGAMTE